MVTSDIPTQPASSAPVRIIDIAIPFWALVRFFVKCAFAVIPARIIISIVYFVILFLIAAVLASLGFSLNHLHPLGA